MKTWGGGTVGSGEGTSYVERGNEVDRGGEEANCLGENGARTEVKERNPGEVSEESQQRDWSRKPGKLG